MLFSIPLAKRYNERVATWRSGNAAVCKTAMHGFDSRRGLFKEFRRSGGTVYLPRIDGGRVAEWYTHRT
jgi:hypothetical protein